MATKAAASVAATCGKVSDHMVRRALADQVQPVWADQNAAQQLATGFLVSLELILRASGELPFRLTGSGSYGSAHYFLKKIEAIGKDHACRNPI